jgi:hypothetical protein
MVLKRPQRILMNLQLLFESILIAISVTNSVNVLGGADSAPPPTLFRVKGPDKNGQEQILLLKQRNHSKDQFSVYMLDFEFF